ncbi:MAG: DUF1211 domain-containing protein [Burkholderiaceae bacterium]|nr:DUF1211 domain-containing protein [Burkholderiaceae bacterium]
MNASPRHPQPEGRPTFGAERIAALSDGVFSIAATLLVLDVRLPAGADEFRWAQLQAVAPHLLGYVISFLVIARMWIAQHRLLQPVERLDARALWLGLLFLMLVAFVPFPTSVLAEHGNRDAVVLYAMTIVSLSLLLSAFGACVGRHPEWLREGEGAVYRREGFRPWAVPAVFALSIPIAWLDPDWAMAFWLLLVPLGLALRR